MNQTIEILMAVYNNAEYILAQLQSLLDQTYPHFRIIIRDDCSKDHSVTLIEQFSQKHPGKILLIRGQDNLGARGNFAALLHYAESDYVMFCDADDVWLPTKIEESLALMQKNEALYGKKTPLLIHTDLMVVDKQLHSLNRSFWNLSKINPLAACALNRLLVHNVITGCTMLINRPLLELAAPIPQEAIMHDWWIGLVASAFGQIDFVAKPSILYRQHGKNDTGAKDWTSVATYLAYAKKGRRELRHPLFKTVQQAALFSHRYGAHLSLHKRKLVENYASFGKANAWQKRYLFFKHRYFKNTFAKNVGMFLLL